MPLDHYVSQVHLKNFYSPTLTNLMHAMRKSDLKKFKTSARDVCRIEKGNTNPYLENERIVEDFLKGIEPNYNASVTKLCNNEIDQKCIYVIAGFIAYILTCSPASIRLGSLSLESTLKETAKIIDSHGSFPNPPEGLELPGVTDLLNSGVLKYEIDKKYPQAIGIRSIDSIINVFGNSKWEILKNPYEKNPFFTSDFPVAIESTQSVYILNRIVPLTPYIAIRIIPNSRVVRDNIDFSFGQFRSKIKSLNRQEVINVNRLLVRCAEDVIFFRDNYEWIRGFVRKNAGFRIDSDEQAIPHGKGVICKSTFVIAKV
jgi:hypothetical protein